MISSYTVGPIVRRYEGTYDPLAIFSRLRRDHLLGPYSYLHLGPEQAELGWAPIERLTLLGGEGCEDWRSKLRAFAHKAKRLGRKAVGYVGFDAVDRHAGTLPDWSVTGQPLVEFMIPGEVATITRDHVEHVGTETVRLERYLGTRQLPIVEKVSSPPRLVGQTPEDEFVYTVRCVLDAIAQGTIQKVVLSRYEAYETDFEPLSVLAALAGHQTSSFLLCFGDLTAVVPSPELLLAGKHRRITTNPLAGTRRCGDSAIEDQRLRNELRSDHKEIVEHVLAVTTMFSELESVCDPETLRVSRLMDIARHKRVQHLSSVLRGTLTENREVLDALWALFPSVTVTGIPKVAALREVRALEANPRYLYSGAIGWVSGSDDCEFMLAIRSVFRHRGRAFLHAGAGIIAESCPQSELTETRHKLSAMKDAIAGNQL
jgi:salicylate synthetase